MKILFFAALWICINTTGSFAQQAKPGNTPDYSAYIQKSKKQKTAAWILLGGGAAMGMSGLLITATELNDNWWDVIVEEQNISPAGEILFYTGVAAMIGSIPLFIGSTKNRKKSETVKAFLKMRQWTAPGAYTTTFIPYPSLTVTIKL